jgi:Leucine-rich repeat (LRR) protein
MRGFVFEQSVLKEGYLEKQSSGMTKSWQSRYFELSGHYIKYYEKKETKSDEALKGAVDLKDVRKVTSAGTKIAIVMNDGTTLNLKSSSEQSTGLWMTEIEQVVSDLKAAANSAHGSYAEPTWTAASWLSSLSLISILSDSLLASSKSGTQSSEIDRIKALSDNELDSAVDSAAAYFKATLRQELAQLKTVKEVNANKVNDKFLANGNCFTFAFGGMKEFHEGLEGKIGNPDPRIKETIEWEHMMSDYAVKPFWCWWRGNTTAREEYDYVVNQSAKETDTKGMAGTDITNGVRDKGRDSWDLQKFWDENIVMIEQAGLLLEEVIVLRLYTGPMYVWYNNLLRYCGVEYNSSRPGAPFDDYKKTDTTEFPFRTTLHALNSAIIKLSRTQRAERVFRGAAGGVLPAEFWKPNEQNVRGGIELAFMSTTTDRDIALHYSGASNASDKPSIIFEMQMGMIDRGAPVQWCSQFPEEAEILFAPLTGCEVVGMPKVENSVIVVELRLNCNLHDLTIEQILAKMQKTHFDLLDIVRTDLTQLGFPQEAYKSFHEHKTKLKSESREDPRWFNNAAHYLSATKEALQCKLEACSYMMQQDQPGSEQCEAAKILLNPDDAMALGHGINLVIREGLQGRYASELEAVSASSNLQELSLDLKGAGLKGQVPDVLVRICSKATFFDLSGNEFEFPNEVGDGRTYLRQVMDHVRNIQAVVEVDLRNQLDLIDVDGLQHYKKLTSLNLSSCSAVQGAERMKKTVAILIDAHTLLSLDLSQNKLGGAEAEILARGITKWRALTKLDMSSNNIGVVDEEQIGKALGVLLESYGTSFEALQEHFEPPPDGESEAGVVNMIVAAMEEVKVVYSDDIKAKVSTACFEPAGFVRFANAIRDIGGTLSLLNLSSNELGAKGTKIVAEAMKNMEVLKHLDISNNRVTEGSQTGKDWRGDPTYEMAISGVVALADAIQHNRALLKLVFGGDEHSHFEASETAARSGKYVTPKPAILEVGMTEADLRNKALGAGGAIIFLAWLTHKDRGALTKLDARGNSIPALEEARLQSACDANAVSLAL